MNLPKNHKARVLCQRLLLRQLPTMRVNQTLQVTDKFDDQKLQERYPNLFFIKTRPFTGFDPKKLDQYNITFEPTKEEEVVTKVYHSRPYYIVRGYSLD